MTEGDVLAFTSALTAFKKTMNDKLVTIANNFHKHMDEQIKGVNDACLRWFTQLKEHCDRNGNDIRALRTEFASIREENNSLKERLSALEKSDEYKTDHAFRLQLIAYNIPETDQDADREDCFFTVRDFMIQKLGISENDANYFPIRDTHRLGRKEAGNIRPIVIAFIQQQHRDFVLSRAKNLRGSTLSLQPHLSRKQLDVKKTLLAKRKDIKEVDPRILAFIGYRRYKPLLLVKQNGRLVEFRSDMPINSLQHGDHIPQPASQNNSRPNTPNTPHSPSLNSPARSNLQFQQPDHVQHNPATLDGVNSLQTNPANTVNALLNNPTFPMEEAEVPVRDVTSNDVYS